MGMRRTTFGLATLSLVVAACGGASGTASTTTSMTDTTTSVPSTTTTSQAPTTTTLAPTTSVAPATTTTASEAVSTTLAGEPTFLGPSEGDVLMVVGVRYDDVLNLRAGPGASQQIVGRIPPTYEDLVALGNTRQLPSSFWTEVDYDGTDGWVHMGYLAYHGGVTTDETARLINELGKTPTASTMTALGEMITGLYVSEDVESDVVQVTEVSSGDLAEVTYDVVGLADDAVRGVRVHVFAEEASGGFRLRTVEVTALCGRGVDTDGLCA